MRMPSKAMAAKSVALAGNAGASWYLCAREREGAWLSTAKKTQVSLSLSLCALPRRLAAVKSVCKSDGTQPPCARQQLPLAPSSAASVSRASGATL